MEDFRMQYPLTSDALVLDAGAYKGDFIEWCRRKWGCRVYSFEPIAAFYANVAARFVADPMVKVFNYGLDAQTALVEMSMRGDSTSVHFGAEATEIVHAQLRDVAEAWAELSLNEVDLFKINIEGGEYSLMPRILDAGLARRVRFFQIQYHGIGAQDPAAAREAIRERLRATHREEWCVNGGQWESWARL